MKGLQIRAGLALLGAVAALVVVNGTGTAGAQTSYPPGACRPLAGSQFNGTLTVGQSATIILAPACAFQDGTPVSVSVNGVPVGVRAAVSGAVPVLIAVTSGASLTVDGNTTVPVVCGVNTVVATGFSAAAQAPVTQTATFNVNCGTGQTPSAALGAAKSGPIAFTGTSIGAFIAFAASVFLLGSAVLVASRRRSRRRWGQ